MNKRVYALLAAVCAAVLVSGCGSNNTSAGAETPNETAAETVEETKTEKIQETPEESLFVPVRKITFVADEQPLTDDPLIVYMNLPSPEQFSNFTDPLENIPAFAGDEMTQVNEFSGSVDSDMNTDHASFSLGSGIFRLRKDDGTPGEYVQDMCESIKSERAARDYYEGYTEESIAYGCSDDERSAAHVYEDLNHSGNGKAELAACEVIRILGEDDSFYYCSEMTLEMTHIKDMTAYDEFYTLCEEILGVTFE